MAYVKVNNNNQIIEYPYSLEKLRSDNKNTSFPRNLVTLPQLLKDFGVHKVVEANIPSIDERSYKLIKKDKPELLNDVWTLGWNTVEKSAEEKQEYYDQAVLRVKNTRTSLLAASDWTQLPDAPVDKIAWATYREALRNITSSSNFPYINDEDWPIQP